jgi:hypothetical protein
MQRDRFRRISGENLRDPPLDRIEKNVKYGSPCANPPFTLPRIGIAI